MFPASCFLPWLAVVAAHQNIFTYSYVKPWDPLRRSDRECEMCYKGECVVTVEPRCEYYAEASKLISNGDVDEETEIHQKDDKIDAMLFELVDSASSRLQCQSCIPLISQYTDCTEENICSGCKFCSCDEKGKWACSEKEKCRQEPKLSVDHRVLGIVIENLKRKENSQERRIKRSPSNTVNIISKNIKNKLKYNDISNWMYEMESLNHEHNNMDVDKILGSLKDKQAAVHKDIDQVPVSSTITTETFFSTSTSVNKNDNYVDFLEFHEILQSLATDDLSTKKPFIVNPKQAFAKHHSKEIHVNDINYIEFDPIRLIKRDISNMGNNGNPTVLQLNTTNNNFTNGIILNDAFQGLNKIINEKQQELKELLSIRSNLLNIAKAHKIDFNINFTVARFNNNNKQIAIYKLNTFEQCVAKVKQEICELFENVIKTDIVSNSSGLQHDLKIIFSAFRNLIVKGNSTEVISSQEHDQHPRRHIDPDNRYQKFNTMEYIRFILVEINKSPTNPLYTLSRHTRKILTRVINQLYLDDFAIIDFIVHETYYDFDNYLENIGTKWNKMMHDVINSQVFDSLYRIKLLHITLKADISKMEDMITLLDFARNRRMTVASGTTIDKSLLRIQNNLQLIDSNVQKIMKLDKTKRMRQGSALQNIKSPKKKSILQKLKNMFQRSKNDIKDMLRKRFPKSEIMKQITKKKIDELEKQRMLEYQETMKQWQENLNTVPGREKRSIWKFQAFADRIKSIIPGYLRGKVKPAMQKNKTENKNRANKTHGRKKQRLTMSSTSTMTASRRSMV